MLWEGKRLIKVPLTNEKAGALAKGRDPGPTIVQLLVFLGLENFPEG
jgi:hypothetical protein